MAEAKRAAAKAEVECDEAWGVKRSCDAELVPAGLEYPQGPTVCPTVARLILLNF